ncbi:hypothetical protein CBE89_00750 [Corynebacterium striatum]|uniref:Uncharacterized protein n=1 Tax=Corynebacterium striatum TaxID=43770 RepID=A0A2Z2IYV2_CORST|nr:hypothetical protein CBE89_00750 [Corynebacterium striatum]
MYIIIVLTALVCAAALAVQTIRRERPQDRMRCAVIGGGTSVAMVLGLIFFLPSRSYRQFLPYLLCRLVYSPCGPAFSEPASIQEPAGKTAYRRTYGRADECV